MLLTHVDSTEIADKLTDNVALLLLGESHVNESCLTHE